MADVSILRIACGMIGTNCYIVSKKGGREAVVIDPADSAPVIAALGERGQTCALILLTHAHFDHIMGVNDLAKEYGCPVAIGSLDAAMLTDADTNGSMSLLGIGYVAARPDRLISDGEAIEAAGMTFAAIAAPGHTKGGMCYLIEDALFSGDVLFCRGVGRTDLFGGDFTELRRSISRLYELPDDTGVFPGHGAGTSIGAEAAANPFVRRMN